jgi:predicted Zn-dependent protease
MVKTSKRLEFLFGMAQTSQDPLVGYGLAMEYRSLERFDEAVTTFAALRARTPTYLPMYLMCGLTLAHMGRSDEAREWFAAGISAAGSAGDTHALSELENARAAVE